MQSSVSIVDGITDVDSQIFWEGLIYFELKEILSSVHIFFNSENIGIWVGESSLAGVVKITDVLLGPFDL